MHTMTIAEENARNAGYTLDCTKYGYSGVSPDGQKFPLEAITRQDAWEELCDLCDLI